MTPRYVVAHCVFFFFFQAEDGIRDLVRSRGLGDVYKRQAQGPVAQGEFTSGGALPACRDGVLVAVSMVTPRPVSYTHLTLPTSDLA